MAEQQVDPGPVRMPVTPMLAAPASALPEGRALPGGCWYEPKYDGYRGLLFVGRDAARVQSRRGHDITRAFPDIAEAAAAALPAGCVLDGELLVWGEGGLDFAALQRRLAAGPNAGRLARRQPAGFLAFDLLATGEADLRTEPLSTRRSALETVLDEVGPPLQLTPYTTDVAVARRWLEDYGRAQVGIEGLVVKGRASPYEPGRRGWQKLRLRDTVEVVVGAVTGTAAAPDRLVVGLRDGSGDLVVAGSTGPLTKRQREEVAPLLVPAGGDHPWPTEIGSGRLGHWGGGPTAVDRVEPTLVVEVSADTALQEGRWRHVTRYVRVRPDLTPEEVAPLGDRSG